MFALNQFVVKKVLDENNTSKFEIGPLPKGYGSTFGVFLRRVLLSSVQGSAITAVKIDGVQHEYSTLSGLNEDILTVMLSLKNVVVVSKTLDTVLLEIDVKGKDGEIVEVKASDIIATPEVEIINPDYVIAKLTSGKAKFKAQITVQRETGFKPAAEEMRKELGMLPLDSNFSPVKLVSYEVASVRVGQETDLDQLNLTIKTNGSITGIEALHIACDTLNQMTTYFFDLTEKLLTGKEVNVELNKKQKTTQSISALAQNKIELKVADLNLSTRLTNALLKSGYEDLNNLEGLTEEELSNIRGMGSKSFTELLELVKKHNIKIS